MATTSPYNLKTNHQVGDTGLVADVNEIAGALNDADGRITNSLQPNEVTVKAARDLAVTGAGTSASPLVIDSPYRWIGTGSPYGVLTPDRKGIEYTDTAQTLGAMAWRSTGTTSTSWVVESGDTGWVPIAASRLLNGWKFGTGGNVSICRVGMRVEISLISVDPSTMTSNIMLALPSGFGMSNTTWQKWPVVDQASIRAEMHYGGRQFAIYGASQSSGIIFSVLGQSFSWFTSDPWPTSLTIA